MTDSPPHDPSPPAAAPAPEPSVPSRRTRRPWLRGVAAVGGVLLLALVVCEVAGWPFLRQPLAQQLSQRLGREVRVDAPFKLRLLGGLRLEAGHLHVAPAPPSDAPLVDAQDLRLALRYGDLLALQRGEPLRVRELSVRQIDANLARDAQGVANWQFKPPQQADDKPAADPVAMPVFDLLAVQDGRLNVLDVPSQVQLKAEFSTTEGGATHVEQPGPRGLRVTADGRWRNSPLKVSLQASGALPLADTRRDAPAVPLRLQASLGQGKLSLDGQVQDLVRLGGLDAQMRVSGPSMAAAGAPFGITLPSTPPFEAQGRVRKTESVWALALARAAVGQTRLAGEFRYDTRPAVPLLTGTLTGERLSLPDLAPAFGAPTAAAPAPRSPNGRVLPQREFDLPSLRAMDADVKVALRRVDLGTVWLQPLEPLDAQLRLSGGALTVSELLARSAGGEVRGSFGLDARNAEQPRWQTDLRWSGVKLEQFVRRPDATAGQNSAPPMPYIAGELTGQVQLRGVGRSTAAMLASLDGSGRLWVRQGRISHLVIEASGIDLAESLGLLVRGDESLPMRCALAQFGVKDGAVRSEVGLIDTEDTTVHIGGGLSLADERLGLVLTARPQDFSPLALRAPVRVEGTFGQPTVRLDALSIGKRVAAAAALAVVTPVAAVLALFDFGETDRAGCEQALARLNVPGAKAAGKPAGKATEPPAVPARPR